MQSEMKFYTTSHFVKENLLPTERVEDMLDNAYVIKSRIPLGNKVSLYKAGRESGERIYAYYRGKKRKWIIVIGKNFKSQIFNVLITIYEQDSPGWIVKAFNRTSIKKRQLLTQYLKFQKAIIVDDVHPPTVPNNKPSQPEEKRIVLTIREFGLRLSK